MNATEPHWWYIKIGSGNGLVPAGKKAISCANVHLDLGRHVARGPNVVGILFTYSTRTTRMPAFWGYPPPPPPAASWLPIPLSHIGSQVKRRQSQSYKFKKLAKFQIFEFRNGHYTWHTFCLIRCANMKWIRWVLLKIQSGHDSVHRRTDGQGDTSIPPYQLRWSGGDNETLLNHNL